MAFFDATPMFKITPPVFAKLFELFKIICPATTVVPYATATPENTMPFIYGIDMCCEIIKYAIENATDDHILQLHNQTMAQIQIQYLRRQMSQEEKDTRVRCLNKTNGLIIRLKSESMKNMVGHINDETLVFILLPDYFSKTAHII